MVSVDLSQDELYVALEYVTSYASISAPRKVECKKQVVSTAKDKKEDPKEKEKKKDDPKEKKDGDDDDEIEDLFGDEEEETAAAAEAPKTESTSRADRMAAAKAEKEKAKKVEKSQVVLDVKPWDAEQDLKALFTKIVSEISMDGLKWGEGYKLAEIAFGIKKLTISCIIEDEKVGLNDLTDMLEAFQDDVQSVDVQSMQRFG